MSRITLRSGQELQVKPPRRRHWWRRILVGLLALVVLVAVAAVAIIRLQPSRPALALPTGAAAAPAGQLEGSWQVATGSVAGPWPAWSRCLWPSPREARSPGPRRLRSH
jgi:hypothetical protein